MKQLIKTSLVVLLLAIASTAQAEDQDWLVVHTKDGRTISFILSDEPKLNVNDNRLTVSSLNEEISMDIQTLDHFSIDKVESTIQDNEETHTTYLTITGGLQARGLQPGTLLRAFKTDGTLAAQDKADKVGQATIQLQSGTYIIKSQNDSFKILIR